MHAVCVCERAFPLGAVPEAQQQEGEGVHFSCSLSDPQPLELFSLQPRSTEHRCGCRGWEAASSTAHWVPLQPTWGTAPCSVGGMYPGVCVCVVVG